MSRAVLIVLLAALVLSAAAFAAVAARPTDLALVELAVGKLTCVSCARKIEGALADMDGVGKVAVDVGGGMARIEYDPDKTDPATIAGLVTRSGYPAALRRVLSPADYKALSEGSAGTAAPSGGSGCGGNCCGKK